MYLVTGGAGFIGSNIVAALSDVGEEVVVCDWMHCDERWRNLAKHDVAAIIPPPQLLAWMDGKHDSVTAVIHMGAVSATTEVNVEHLAENNIRTTLGLLEWCTDTQTPLIYASSAATYGDGATGFEDDNTVTALKSLRPLNAYGWSKHFVDRRIAQLAEKRKPLPPQCVGLKFFNVYGPNEYHKGGMRSVIASSTSPLLAGEPLHLFRSYRTDYADGGQLRDFIFVKDCVDIILWFLQNPTVSGLFNVGTGKARSWYDLARAMFAAIDRPTAIQYIDMPSQLVDKYQYFTEAKVDRLRRVGYGKPFTTLEAGVGEYIRNYLSQKDPYR